jgi:uncharacterized protein (DUF433 family)
MDIEAYLDRTPEGEIFVRGTRIDLATVVEAYLEGLSPEEIILNYPTLSLEQVYATVTYYLASGEPSVRVTDESDLDRFPDAPVVTRLRAIASRQARARERQPAPVEEGRG